MTVRARLLEVWHNQRKKDEWIVLVMYRGATGRGISQVGKSLMLEHCTYLQLLQIANVTNPIGIYSSRNSKSESYLADQLTA